MAPDFRKVMGTAITCKATHVLPAPDCNRRYGSRAKLKVLDGIVVNVIQDRATFSEFQESKTLKQSS
jgi:hypothetical protein